MPLPREYPPKDTGAKDKKEKKEEKQEEKKGGKKGGK